MDFLAAEQALIDHLQVQVPTARQVLRAADLAGVAESQQVTPALHVVYAGHRITRTTDQTHTVVEAAQRWLVAVAVYHAGAAQGARGAREAAGPLLGDTFQALAGWVPTVVGVRFSPFQAVAAPAPYYSPGGYAYFATGWETLIRLRGEH